MRTGLFSHKQLPSPCSLNCDWSKLRSRKRGGGLNKSGVERAVVRCVLETKEGAAVRGSCALEMLCGVLRIVLQDEWQ